MRVTLICFWPSRSTPGDCGASVPGQVLVFFVPSPPLSRLLKAGRGFRDPDSQSKGYARIDRGSRSSERPENRPMNLHLFPESLRGQASASPPRPELLLLPLVASLGAVLNATAAAPGDFVWPGRCGQADVVQKRACLINRELTRGASPRGSGFVCCFPSNLQINFECPTAAGLDLHTKDFSTHPPTTTPTTPHTT